MGKDGQIDKKLSGWWAYEKNHWEGKDNFREGELRDDDVYPILDLE